ncbi:hypothetical protein ACHAPJ_000863 [Fusarium lateritium]
MKLSLASLALVAATGFAAPPPDFYPPWFSHAVEGKSDKTGDKMKREAIPEPVAAPKPNPVSEPEPWCTYPGQSCWKAKREAAPEPEPWCWYPGQSCWKVKRDVGEALAGALHSTRHFDTAHLDTRSIDGTTHTESNHAARQAKRSVVELANMVALAARGSSDGYFKSLNIERHFPDTAADGMAKRDLHEVKREAAPQRTCVKWCMCPGQSCWKAKRAAEAVLETLEGRDAGSHDSHFDARGESVTDKRDIMAIKAAARSIIDANQE